VGKAVRGDSANASALDKPSRAEAQSPRTAFSHSPGLSLCVSVMGDSCAACRISSEYALPIPLSRRGSVKALLRVWFLR